MQHYQGEFESTIDQRGRFVLPQGVMKQFVQNDAQQTSFMISRGFEKCLTIYSIESWDAMIAKINKLNDFDPKVRAFRRLFMGGATKVELDTSNRLTTPSSLKEYADLSKDIIITAANGKFELWDKKTYMQFFEDTTTDQFSDLAAEVMGNLNDDK
jgi:MraZ protein